MRSAQLVSLVVLGLGVGLAVGGDADRPARVAAALRPAGDADGDRSRRVRVALALRSPRPPVPSPAAEPLRWRTDYVSAAAEAKKAGVNLVTVIGSPNCPACRRLEAGPLADGVVEAELQKCVPLRLDGDRVPDLVAAVGVTLYPTVIVSAPDGTILHRITGYLPAAELVRALRP